MAATSKGIPEGFHTLTPHIVCKNASEAIAFYQRAFGAEEVMRMPAPDGERLMHATVRIGDSNLMLCDEFPEMGGCSSPQSLGGSPCTLSLYVNDADSAFQRATDAGATVTMPLADMFWGARYGRVKDPFGHEWAIATHIKDVSPQEMVEAAKQAFA